MAEIKENQVFSELQFYKVVKVAGDKVQLKNDNGDNIVVDTKYVENCLQSANIHTEEKEITKTEMAQLFINSSRMALTVNFNKQVKDTDAAKELQDFLNGTVKIKDIAKESKSFIKRVLQGEERTMIGRHYGTMDDFGRVNFVDMEKEKDPSKTYDTRLRLVDPRTINWLIVAGVKYVRKDK